jgi:hypothetical protein
MIIDDDVSIDHSLKKKINISLKCPPSQEYRYKKTQHTASLMFYLKGLKAFRSPNSQSIMSNPKTMVDKVHSEPSPIKDRDKGTHRGPDIARRKVDI